MFRYFRVEVLVLLMVLALQGCSSIKLAYPQLPTLSYWWLDRVVSFDSEQAVQAKEALTQLHRWHRSEELVLYADFLQRMALLSEGPVEPAQVCSALTQVQTRMERLMRETVRHAAALAMMLGPRQLNHIARHWETDNQTWEKDWLRGDEAARLERRMDRVIERYRDFYGSLNAQQTAWVKAQLAQSPWTPEWGYQDRLRRQKDLLTTLQRVSQDKTTDPLPVAQVEAQLWALWQRWVKPLDAADAALQQTLSQQACNNLAQLHNSASTEQRQRATRRIRAYERDLRGLIQP